MSSRRLALLAGALLIVVFLISRVVCLPLLFEIGVSLPRCPDGEIRQTARVEVNGLQRHQAGQIWVGALGHYTLGPADQDLVFSVPRVEPSVELTDATGKAIELTPALVGKDKAPSEWAAQSDGQSRLYDIPEIPDGDYTLTAKVSTPLGASSVDVPIPFYSPARIHVITDRPLYQPGDTVKFRAVVFRARDLIPLDERPGRWTMVDPTGETLLEEKASAGSWGVVAGDFPLDAGAATGTWRLRWTSGNDHGERSFEVEPFQLPRFSVEATSEKPFYTANERPVLRGSVTYSSGAPVAQATVDLSWSFGAWPPPTSWLEGELPERVTTGKNGRFELRLPRVPSDLRGRVTMAASISATDPAGDRVTGAAAVLLSEDRIGASAATEFGGRLVEGFNNRLYLRVTTPFGSVLPNTELVVKRAWDRGDPGVRTTTDEDGVAALQFDPGPPINVLIPPPPVRRPRSQPVVTRVGANDLITNAAPSLADQVAMDAWNRRIEPCARFVDGEAASARVALRVGASGKVRLVVGDGGVTSNCVAAKLQAVRLPPGADRLLVVRYAVNDPDTPRVHLDIDGEPYALDALRTALARAALDARECLGPDVPQVGLRKVLVWRTVPKSKRLEYEWIGRSGTALPAKSLRCIEQRITRATLASAASDVTTGIVRFSVTPSQRRQAARPQPTMKLGYELSVAASADGEALGITKLVIEPGQVPQVRLRTKPVLPKPGDTVTVQVIRGPGFKGKLPKYLHLRSHRQSIKAELDHESKVASFVLPKDASGWYTVHWNATARIYVRPKTELKVAVAPDRAQYKPGDVARLSLHTTALGQGVPAAVGLFGVDQSLAQLRPLPGPSDMEGVRPKVSSPSPAFGVLDGQALAMGRITGANAAAAAILGVQSIEAPAALDVSVSAVSAGTFYPLAPLTDRFYVVLGELHAQTRSWEQRTKKGELMTPSKMAKLWTQALDACAARGDPVDDAFGRRLRLVRLPPDLLALAAPRSVVVDGTRLPEDVEDWAAWVAKERP